MHLDSYVRELLGALTASRMVQLAAGTGGRDGVTAAFLVPDDHRGHLMKAATRSLLFSALADQYSAVKTSFSQDGPSCRPRVLFTLSLYLGNKIIKILIEH